MRAVQLGFRGRLLLGAVIPALLMVSLLEMAFFSRYQADLERTFHARGEAIARQLGPVVEYALFSGSRETLFMLADGMRKGDPEIVSVNILDREGRVIVQSGPSLQQKLPLADGLQMRASRLLTTVQVPVLQTTLPVAEEVDVWEGKAAAVTPQLAGYIAVEISRAELLSRQKEMLEITLAIMLGGLLLAGWLSFKIAGDVLAQLDAATAELHRQKDAAELLARTDELTGLANRRAFVDAASHEIQRAMRYGAPLALVITDLDYFKSINDNYGHHVGDVVLRNFANILTASIREVDLAGRWGGEEFVVLMPDTSLEEAVQAAERMRLAVAGAPAQAGQHRFGYTASFGVAAFSADIPTLDALLSRADAALYRAKDSGRNRVEVG